MSFICVLSSLDLVVHDLAGSFPVLGIVDGTADDDHIRSFVDHGIDRLHVDAAGYRYLSVLDYCLYSVQFIQRIVVIGLGILGRMYTDIVYADLIEPFGSCFNVPDADQVAQYLTAEFLG